MAFVTCPHCGTRVPKDALRCPACHDSLIAPARQREQRGSWCPSCGVAVMPTSKTCPNCGAPLPPDKVESPMRRNADRIAAQLPRIETPSQIEPALPAEPIGYDEPYDEDVTSRTPRVFVAAAAALVFIGALAVLITHPWDPDAYSIKAKTAADTSMVGFPGTIDRLTSQDSASNDERPSAEAPTSPEQATYRALKEDWGSLGEIEARLSQSEGRLRSIADEGAEAQSVSAEVEAFDRCAVELSNLIEGIDSTDVSSGAYAEDVANLSRLGNWLRNWSDTLREAWSRAQEVEGDAGEYISAPLEAQAGPGGTNTYHALFLQNYAAYEPSAPANEPAGSSATTGADQEG